ncbi:TonB-dependent receptor [Pseudoalteromonas rubra]|uniref:TonB-dependent receptor n=1 Tax=Pseudoalteromonas rubra TaxID=43658 RepID=A0A0F4QYC3_9GAMM|nr:TonB-dependent receptor [Pseudoalteromonas rubra]KJZ12691.1 TonB-dependent receptor [Pseudoalteromonas rubra]
MNTVNYKLSHVAILIGAVLGTSMVQAEEAVSQVAEETPEVIEVRGIKGSLIRSMNVKRDMSGVVDAISAEEMGKFPDTNLAESLQRITGVAVSRSNGEGSQITVRGFGPDFNLVTLNGRQMPGTGNSRSYNFENLSSDGVTALEVYKTARADNPTGGLGATVNIVTARPLDSGAEKMSFSAKAIHDSSNVAGDDITPEVSALYSNAFLDETVGFGFNINHHRRDFQQQSANIQGWQANVDLPTNLEAGNVIDNRPLNEQGVPAGDYFFPRDMNYQISDLQRERTNGQVVFQYAPGDDLVMTLDYTGTKSITGKNGISWGMWNDYGGNINGYELDENGTVVYADISGNDGSFSASRSTTEVKERSIGFNVQWQASDTLSLTLDYHDSQSETDNGADVGLGSEGTLVLGSDQLTTKRYDYRSGEIPHAEILWKNGTNELAASEIDSHFSQFVHSPGKATVEQLQLDGVWENLSDRWGLVNIKFGVARTEQEMSGSNAWSGLIGGFLFNPAWPELFPDGMFTQHDTSDFLNAFDGGGSALQPHYYYTFDFDEVAARSEAFLTNELLGGKDYFATTAYHDMGTLSRDSVTEETSSIYLSSFWEFEVASYPVQINAGVRYEQTDVTSSTFQPTPTAVWWKGGSEWHTQYVPDGDAFFTLEGEHDVVLPMVDLRVDVTDELVARLSWGKTISRAPLGDLVGGRSLTNSPKIGSRNASEGNTNLQPFESTNFDLSLEYYYSEGSYAAIGYFDKSVKNFIGSQVNSTTVDGFHDIYQGPRWLQAVADIESRGEQATNDAIFAQMQANGATLNEQGYITPNAEDPLIVWDFTRPFNAPDTKSVDGIEVAVQHLIGETGFGVGVNATFVNGDVEFDVASLKQQTPLTGLSDSANFQVFYELDGLSVKLTYAWRDEYLIGVGQDQGSSDNPPQFAKAFGQWDMSVNYDMTEQLTVFFEGVNLNDETEQGFGRYERQFLFARQYGPRYALGFRYTFN